MKPDKIAFEDVYTRKVGGETYHYEAEYNEGATVEWRARVYQGDVLKGTPAGTIIDNTMAGDALKKYVIAYIESIIEKGLGIDE